MPEIYKKPEYGFSRLAWRGLKQLAMIAGVEAGV